MYGDVTELRRILEALRSQRPESLAALSAQLDLLESAVEAFMTGAPVRPVPTAPEGSDAASRLDEDWFAEFEL